ncbi:uncharacterized protein LOC143041212 [Oratosquilla oratoria]|uniref:uncharacterized protein LOC143041212 n=1 Tax=Oratosquilla oratoria TaxID=337810 RepID=UPI003F75CC95
MGEDSKTMKRRNRHFWGWVTREKKLTKGELNANKKLTQQMKSEHMSTFPDLYQQTKVSNVKESIKVFQRKLLTFNKKLNEDKNYNYSDDVLDSLEVYVGEIPKERTEGFEKHYFAGYKSFTKNGGKSDHTEYQKHYLQRTFQSQRRLDKAKKYAIKRACKEMPKYVPGVVKKDDVSSTDTVVATVDTVTSSLNDITATEPLPLDPDSTLVEIKTTLRETKREIEATAKSNPLRRKRRTKAEIAADKVKREEDKKRKKAIKQQIKFMKRDNFLASDADVSTEAFERINKMRVERKDLGKKPEFLEMKERLALSYRGHITETSEAKVTPHSVGELGAFRCKMCQALLFKRERKTMCCNGGKTPINTLALTKLGDNIKGLYDGSSPLSNYFLKNIVAFNNVFCFTSFATSGALNDKRESALCYKIQGKVYHRLGLMKPGLLTGQQNDAAVVNKPFWKSAENFLDLYFYHDKEQQIKLRCDRFERYTGKKDNEKEACNETVKRRRRENAECLRNENIIEQFYDYLTNNNVSLKGMLEEIKTAKKLIETYVENRKKIPDVTISLETAEKVRTKEHKGVYSLPTASCQVGAIVNFGPDKDTLKVTIASPLPDSNFALRMLSSTNFFYDIFQYPLLLPNGDRGYSFKMEKKGSSKCLSALMYYSALYMEREGIFNYILRGRRLFQQFVVDNYVKIETSRLRFLEYNHSNIRKERIDLLRVNDKNRTGQRIILPPTFVGGPRYMKQRQQDALAYVSSYGSPDYFITFTMNPKWSDLTEALEKFSGPGTQPCDRPDIVSRVFKLKLDSLIDDLTQKNAFGPVKAHLYSVEWQKRGLPHAHILLWMSIRVTADIISQIIRAEIPDKEQEPRLYETVTRCMIHGPCKGYDESQVCCLGKSSKPDKCAKGYPKTCRNDLLFGNNGYPEYVRRSIGEGGNSFQLKLKDGQKTIDNSWVVPYNPFLCLKYDAHINVECSNSIKAIAYVTKYVNKGSDRILFTKTSGEDEVVNEVKNFQEARYINANEATWKILKFEIHRSSPPVFALDIHLEGENSVFYSEGASEQEITSKIQKDTQLTAFFKLCNTDEFAATLYYNQLPFHYVYDAQKAIWEERLGRTYSLGRIRAVTTKTVELFYLRLLLTHKKGPKSFEDLRTIDGVMYETNREAVKALGLLSDEETWKETIFDIINHTNDRNQLRETYASMLVFSDLEDQSGIWEEVKDYFSSDYLHKAKLTEYNDEIYLDALDNIQQHVWNCGGGSITEYGLPSSRGGKRSSNVIRREKAYNKQQLKENVDEKIKLLNDKQRNVYETVMKRVKKGYEYSNNSIFVKAAGGTGKSFVLNLLLDTVRSQGKIALAVASSGIAATVLSGGRTAHNMFKIPLMEHRFGCCFLWNCSHGSFRRKNGS